MTLPMFLSSSAEIRAAPSSAPSPAIGSSSGGGGWYVVSSTNRFSVGKDIVISPRSNCFSSRFSCSVTALGRWGVWTGA